MDIKLKTSELLLRKLSFGCGDAQLQAVAEIRLFSKWDDANRVSLARAGAIPLLLELLGRSAEARVQENAVTALLNMSINSENKVLMVREEGGLEAVMQVANQGGSSEAKTNAAALLYSLVADDEVRRIVGSNESLWATFLRLLREGSAKCKAEALKALFVAAGDDQIRENLLQEGLEAVSLLISMATGGKERLTEDCLAVLAALASCGSGAVAVRGATTGISVLLYLLSSGSARAKENAAAVLLNMCRNDEEARQVVPLKTLIPALNSLYLAGSERGKGKAEGLLRLLGFEEPLYMSRDPNSDSNCNVKPVTMPFLGPRDPPIAPHHNNIQSNPSSSINHHHNASSSSHNKYFNFARNLFTSRPRRKSRSSIT